MASVRVSRLSHLQIAALVATGAGLLTLITAFPAGLRFALLGLFVVLAPGTAVLSLMPPLERSLRLLLTPAIGISLVILASTLSAVLDYWHPTVQLVVLVALTGLLILAGSMGAREGSAVVPAESVPADSVPAESVPADSVPADSRTA